MRIYVTDVEDLHRAIDELLQESIEEAKVGAQENAAAELEELRAEVADRDERIQELEEQVARLEIQLNGQAG